MLKTIRLVFIIVAVFNFAEYFSVLPESAVNLYIIFICLLLLFISVFFKSSQQIEKEMHKKAIIRLFLIIIFSNFLLLLFVLKNIDDLSILGLAIFMEKYRNGFYQGSGIYTFLSTNIIPLLLSFYIYNFHIGKRVLAIFLILSIVPLLTLGLRVFLIPIVFSLLFRHFNKKNILSMQSLILFSIIVILIFSTKLLLTPDTISSSLGEATGKVLTRTNYQSVTIPFGINGGFGFLLSGEIDNFKDLFYRQNNTYIDRLYLSEILNSSGLAIPLLSLFIILFGYLFGSMLLMILFFLLFKYISISLNYVNDVLLIKNIMRFYLVIFILSSFVEDFSFLYKILYIPILWFIILMFEKPKFRIQ